MKEKVVLITGISSPFGMAMAKVFSENGFCVLGLDRSEPADRQFIKHVEIVDLKKTAHVQQAINKVLGSHKEVSLLINKAEKRLNKTLMNMPIESIEDHFMVNSVAPLLLAKLTYGKLKESKGSIINIGPVEGMNDHAVYAASKGSVIAMTQALAAELGPDIRVNTLMPTGTPEEVAKAIFELATTEMNAKTFIVDQGALGEWNV